MARPYDATNAPGTCPWCGRKLQTHRKDGSPVSPFSSYGPFDTLACAQSFARAAHKNGYRLAAKVKP